MCSPGCDQQDSTFCSLWTIQSNFIKSLDGQFCSLPLFIPWHILSTLVSILVSDWSCLTITTLIGLVSLRPGSLPWWQYFFYVNTGLGWVYGTAGLTGVFLIIILLIMVVFSLKVVRKKGFFEVYWLVVHVVELIISCLIRLFLVRCFIGPTISSFPGTSCWFSMAHTFGSGS